MCGTRQIWGIAYESSYENGYEDSPVKSSETALLEVAGEAQVAQNDAPKAILTFWRAIFKFMEASWAKMYSPAAKHHALCERGGSAAMLLS